MSSAATTTDRVADPVDLGALERVAEAWCGALEPAIVSGADAASAVERLAVVVRKLEAAKVLLANRAEECNAYRARAQSGPDWYAAVNGISKTQAKRALDTAKRLEACPATRSAFANGDISTDEADAVSDAANADPGSEARLLDGAKARHDLRETRAAADKIRRAAMSAEDEQARHARLHKARSLRIGQTRDGHVEIRGQFTPAAFAGVKPIIDAHLKRRLEQARRDSTRDGWDAYRADALLDAIAANHRTATTPPAPPPAASSTSPTATAPARPPADPAPLPEPTDPPAADPAEGRLFTPGADIATAEGLDPKVNWNLVILVDGIALKRGYAAPGETCEIPGIGSIPIAWINQLLPQVHTELLIHDSVDIRAYATTTRHRTRPVELAVHVRDRDCVIPRCHRDPTEFDHRTPYTDTHDTSVANGNRLCTPDHRNKTHHGSTLDRNDTHWLYWPPDTDPTTHQPLTAPIGAHLTTWNLDHRPGDDPGG